MYPDSPFPGIFAAKGDIPLAPALSAAAIERYTVPLSMHNTSTQRPTRILRLQKRSRTLAKAFPPLVDGLSGENTDENSGSLDRVKKIPVGGRLLDLVDDEAQSLRLVHASDAAA